MTDLIKQLTGRARFCRDRGEEKTPGLLEEAAAQFADAQAAQAMVRFWKHMAETHNDRATALAAANAALEAKVAGLRDFVDDFAKAKIDALRYSPPYGSSPEDEPDPVVDAETVWAWQADAKAALATQEAGNA